MLALLISAFFFIGVFTYYNFKNQNQNYHYNRLLRKEASTLSSISYFIKNQNNINYNDIDISALFQNKIFELSDIHNLDLVFYNLSGNLVLSSNEELLKNN